MVIFALLAALAGCSFGEGSERSSVEASSRSPEPMVQVCDGLLGKLGGKTLAEISQGESVLPLSSGERSRLSKVAASMIDEVRHDTKGKEGLRNVCAFKGPVDGEAGMRTVKLDFGWSQPPEKTERGHFYYTAGSALVDDYYFDSWTPTRLFYSCALASGAGGVVQVSINSHWPVDRDKRSTDAMIAKVLLIAAQKMRAELGCVNDLDLSPDSEVEVVMEAPHGMKAGLPLPRVPESGPVQR
ncbi:hypothetical protein [Streptomyces sp. Z26]|uniref:hypothetical protein n=1 Tax=Streptomyces sp. Z26 TaxID=2500177 RepID=UPI000FCAD4C6|nr:hypothetical protein [Streptomyces sp. Z26]